jgi:sugar phosphate isomerase/epimerase
MKLSYVTANLIGAGFGFNGDHDWGKLDPAMIEQTTPQTFRKIAKAVKAMGFDGIEIYTGHCSYLKRDLDYARAVRDVCDEEGLPIVAYAGRFGTPVGTRDDFRKTFAMCKALGTTLMAGVIDAKDWGLCAKMLRDEGLVIGLETNPEKNAEEVLAKIAGHEDVIKVTLDTGNLTSEGGDARVAAEKLMPHIVHLHLKDVKAVGGRDTVALGKGVARVKDALDYVIAHGYKAWASIEHEPYDRDPDPEVKESLVTVRKWLAKKGK